MIGREEIASGVRDFLGHDDEEVVASVMRRLEARRSGSGKVCSGCCELKPLSAFGQDTRQSDGLRRLCRECANQNERQRYREHLA